MENIRSWNFLHKWTVHFQIKYFFPLQMSRRVLIFQSAILYAGCPMAMAFGRSSSCKLGTCSCLPEQSLILWSYPAELAQNRAEIHGCHTHRWCVPLFDKARRDEWQRPWISVLTHGRAFYPWNPFLNVSIPNLNLVDRCEVIIFAERTGFDKHRVERRLIILDR